MINMPWTNVDIFFSPAISVFFRFGKILSENVKKRGTVNIYIFVNFVTSAAPIFVVLLTHTYQQTYTQKLQFKYLFDTFKDKSLHLSDVMQNYTYKSTSRPHWTNTQKHKHIHTLTHTYTHKHTPKHTMTQARTKTYANTSKE